ncbi:class A beta-lactamase-related serine hydrolase [Solimonas sp. K1W22B-7]|uniref:serine hydrolase domain-containing protein n=1 Tax=Solimonas sp. K1W22B-7 TaxID=2303331 RepID=UPI000E32FEAE|nr:serine hydrolase domain-containing protein [Solimonas sp. K1W22B-7]AXQ28932.1 class A beta-lactamase-related serine hydrolase [Solimonas sp. K1W22B-7]
MLMYLRPGRIAVPRDLRPLTAIDHAAECRPQDVGMTEDGVNRIWRSVESLYRSGLQPAITLVIRRHGRIVMKRALGAVSGNGPGDSSPLVPLQPDAPICLFSASKAISALLLHKLIEQGKLRLEDRIADTIPEFAQCGKGRVTVRQLLGHRAGIPDLPHVDPKPELLLEWDEIVRLLCEAKPFDPDFDKQAYHALTAGFIVGELLRRITGRELPELLREWIAEPLGCRYMTYGLAAADRAKAPRNACTGITPVWPLTRLAQQVLGVPFDAAVEASNADAFYDAVVPAGNIWATADETSRVFQMLLNGGTYDGRRLFKPETVREMTTRVGRSWQFDHTLGIPMPFSPGFMLGANPVGLYGLNSGQAFGHIGFMTVICWADPARDISVALLNTGKSLSPSGFLRVTQVVGAIGSACPAV